MVWLAVTVLSLSLRGPVAPTAQPSRPALEELAAGWDDLTPAQQDRARQNYDHYRDLPAEKRNDIDQRYEKWKKLPRSDQDHFREKHDQYRGLGLVGD